jgi:hypothetical protein
MAFGILEKQILLFQDTLMQIGLVILMIERHLGRMFLCGEQSCSLDDQETSLYISLSTSEAEYIAAGSCCTQLLWMKTLLGDYGFSQDTMTINCDNTSAINISKNPV